MRVRGVWVARWIGAVPKRGNSFSRLLGGVVAVRWSAAAGSMCRFRGLIAAAQGAGGAVGLAVPTSAVARGFAAVQGGCGCGGACGGAEWPRGASRPATLGWRSLFFMSCRCLWLGVAGRCWCGGGAVVGCGGIDVSVSRAGRGCPGRWRCGGARGAYQSGGAGLRGRSGRVLVRRCLRWGRVASRGIAACYPKLMFVAIWVRQGQAVGRGRSCNGLRV